MKTIDEQIEHAEKMVHEHKVAVRMDECGPMGRPDPQTQSHLFWWEEELRKLKRQKWREGK